MSNGMRKGLADYGDAEFSLYLRKAFIKAMGYSDEALDRPIVGITNTFSGYNACHRTVPDLIDTIKRGVMLAGGLPVEFPTFSIHKSFSYPTSMFLRNLMAMDAEEMIRAQPMDSVVMIGGCDKTLPAQVMADRALLGLQIAGTLERLDRAGRVPRREPLVALHEPLVRLVRRRRARIRRTVSFHHVGVEHRSARVPSLPWSPVSPRRSRGCDRATLRRHRP